MDIGRSARVTWTAAMLALYAFQPALGAASVSDTPEGGVNLLIKSIRPADAGTSQELTSEKVRALIESILPASAAASRQMFEAFLQTLAMAKDHDDEMRKRFGASLTDASGYVPAESAVLSLVTILTPLAAVESRSTAQILGRSSSSAAEAVYRVRWQRIDGRVLHSVEEVVVPVKEGSTWSLLFPGLGHINFGSRGHNDDSEDYVSREGSTWSATGLRSEDEASKAKIELLKASVQKIGNEVRSGLISDANAYVKAVQSLEIPM